MKKYINLLFYISISFPIALYANIVHYKVVSVGGRSCSLNFASVQCPIVASHGNGITYDTKTKILSLTMFQIGPNNTPLIMQIPFTNNTADNITRCFAVTGDSVPISNCQDSNNPNIMILTNADFDSTNQNILISQMATVFRTGENGILTIHDSNIALTP